MLLRQSEKSVQPAFTMPPRMGRSPPSGRATRYATGGNLTERYVFVKHSFEGCKNLIADLLHFP